MKSGWDTTKLITAGSLGVLLFLLNLPMIALGELFIIPNLMISFFGPMMVVLACLIVDKFGVATLGGFIYSLLVLPLSSFGPPGFLPKVLVTPAAGFLVDLTYLSLKKNKRLASLAAGVVTNLGILILFYFLFALLNFPFVEGTFIKRVVQPIVLPPFALEGAIAGWAGWKVYLKIENTSIIKRIQR